MPHHPHANLIIVGSRSAAFLSQDHSAEMSPGFLIRKSETSEMAEKFSRTSSLFWTPKAHMKASHVGYVKLTSRLIVAHEFGTQDSYVALFVYKHVTSTRPRSFWTSKEMCPSTRKQNDMKTCWSMMKIEKNLCKLCSPSFKQRDYSKLFRFMSRSKMIRCNRNRPRRWKRIQYLENQSRRQ